ncbi:MAG: alpha/beta hydrolase [Lachnospiraceae bacterium]|nr:alpha/beta hydrolase [Lachnospiraceae bacterium]
MEFTSFDGEKIWYKIWEADKPRAVIQIMTGLAEVADYYEIFAPEMVKAGYTVALHEYRKHGRTRAEYGEGNLFRNYAKDGSSFCAILRRSFPELPVVLFAHSLGTTVSQIAIYEKMVLWDGIIYTGPSHAVIAPERMEELLAITDRDILLHGENSVNVMIFPLVFGRLNAPFASDRSSLGFITSDAERRRWLADLPYESPSYTNRFFRDFVVMQADLAVNETLENTRPPLTDTPVLFLTGGDDVTAQNGTYGDTQARLLLEAGYKDVTSIVYAGLRHSLLQETAYAKVIEDIKEWILKRF